MTYVAIALCFKLRSLYIDRILIEYTDGWVVVQKSFTAVKSWIRELKQYADADIVVAIAGNKCDLEDLREIQYKGFQSFYSSLCIIVISWDATHFTGAYPDVAAAQQCRQFSIDHTDMFCIRLHSITRGH